MEEEDPFEPTVVDPRARAAVDPGSIYSRTLVGLSSDDLHTLKQRFPRLREFSDEFLRNRSMEELLRIESTSLKMKDAERRGDAEDKLALNKQNLAANVVQVAGGPDDRWSTLHQGRFLGGAACSARKIWLMA